MCHICSTAACGKTLVKEDGIAANLGVGFGVWVSGFRFWVLGFRIEVLSFGVEVLGIKGWELLNLALCANGQGSRHKPG